MVNTKAGVVGRHRWILGANVSSQEESQSTTELQPLVSKCTDLKPLEKLGEQKTPSTNSLHENKHTHNYLRASHQHLANETFF